MARPAYYSQQAKVLLSLALATTDAKLAEKLRAQAELYLAQAKLPDETGETFSRLLDDYNEDRMRGIGGGKVDC